MKICTYFVYFILMGLVIMIFPYIMTAFNRFNKDRVLVWRKFFIISSVCFLPLIFIVAGSYLYLGKSRFDFFTFYYHYMPYYYFIYIALAIFLKKHINLQLGWWKFIILTTTCYFVAFIGLPPKLFALCNDPLIDSMALPHY